MSTLADKYSRPVAESIDPARGQHIAASLSVAADVEEALSLANDSEFGLSCALWTADLARARRLARRIEAGGVFINGTSASDPRVRIGGVKSSGYGRELSYFGVREFMNAQTVWAGRR